MVRNVNPYLLDTAYNQLGLDLCSAVEPTYPSVSRNTTGIVTFYRNIPGP